MNRKQKNKKSQRRGGNSARRRRDGSGSQGDGIMAHPPMFTPTVCSQHTFRFTTSSAISSSITRKNLLNLLLVATSAVTTVRPIQAIRLKAVEMWVEPLSLGSAGATGNIEWLGENSPSLLLSDTSVALSPAHVRSNPPPSSSNRWWSISGSLETDVLFKVAASNDCTIDVRVELRFVDDEAPTAGDIPAGATLGQWYYNLLDGIGGSIPPIGGNQLP